MGKTKVKEPRLYKDPVKDKAFKKRFNIKGDYQSLKRLQNYISVTERLG